MCVSPGSLPNHAPPKMGVGGCKPSAASGAQGATSRVAYLNLNPLHP